MVAANTTYDIHRVPTEAEINDSLRTLVVYGIIKVPGLEFLVTSFKQPKDQDLRNELLDRVHDWLIFSINHNILERWDFDPWDKRCDSQELLPVNYDHTDLEKWLYQRSPSVNKAVLTVITACFRKKCKESVAEICAEFSEATDFEGTMEILHKAASMGMLKKDTNNHVSHCHSYVDSKQVFICYEDAISRVPRRPRLN